MGIEKITRDQATLEVNAWLDHKRVKERVRDENKDSIEDLIDAFVDGDLRLNQDTFEITQTLNFPLQNSDGDITVRELVYMPRIHVGLVNEAMKGIKATELTKMLTANVAALTKKPYAVINKLDYDDYKTARTIAGFFL